MVTFPHLARPLTSVRGSDRPAVGGKAATLGELTAAGIPVPSGFVVTTAAFDHALRVLDPEGAIPRQIGQLPAADEAAIAEVSGQVRERILATPLPAEVRSAITGRYRPLAQPANSERRFRNSTAVHR